MEQIILFRTKPTVFKMADKIRKMSVELQKAFDYDKNLSTTYLNKYLVNQVNNIPQKYGYASALPNPNFLKEINGIREDIEEIFAKKMEFEASCFQKFIAWLCCVLCFSYKKDKAREKNN